MTEPEDRTELTDIAATTVGHALPGAPPSDLARIVAAVLAEVEREYEGALVAGLCREGAIEVARDTAARAARREAGRRTG